MKDFEFKDVVVLKCTVNLTSVFCSDDDLQQTFVEVVVTLPHT